MCTVNGVPFDGTAGGGVTNLNDEGNVIFDPVDHGGTVADIVSLATQPLAVSASTTNGVGYYRIIGNP